MTKVEFQRLQTGSWLEDTSGIFEVSGISPDGLMTVKEVIFVDDTCTKYLYGVSHYIMRSEVMKMELIAE